MSHLESIRGWLAQLPGTLLGKRRVVRAPIYVYRARLGLVFGGRLLMLEHIGRSSGLRRYVVLEVVDRPAPGQYVVASGFGRRSQWLQNVLHNPDVRIWLGSHRPVPATAALLEPAEGAELLTRYAQRHPRAWKSLRPVFEQTLDAPITMDGTSLPLVRLTIHTTDAPA